MGDCFLHFLHLLCPPAPPVRVLVHEETQEVVEHMKQVIKTNPQLSVEERNLLSVAYKNKAREKAELSGCAKSPLFRTPEGSCFESVPDGDEWCVRTTHRKVGNCWTIHVWGPPPPGGHNVTKSKFQGFMSSKSCMQLSQILFKGCSSTRKMERASR